MRVLAAPYLSFLVKWKSGLRNDPFLFWKLCLPFIVLSVGLGYLLADDGSAKEAFGLVRLVLLICLFLPAIYWNLRGEIGIWPSCPKCELPPVDGDTKN